MVSERTLGMLYAWFALLWWFQNDGEWPAVTTFRLGTFMVTKKKEVGQAVGGALLQDAKEEISKIKDKKCMCE